MHLQNSLVIHLVVYFELTQLTKTCSNFATKTFISFYKSPSHIQDEFKTFSKNLELTLDKIHENNLFMTIVLGDLV